LYNIKKARRILARAVSEGTNSKQHGVGCIWKPGNAIYI
jgi:hypothetical protein